MHARTHARRSISRREAGTAGGGDVKDKLSISSADTDKPHSSQQFSCTAPARRVNISRALVHLPFMLHAHALMYVNKCVRAHVRGGRFLLPWYVHPRVIDNFR